MVPTSVDDPGCNSKSIQSPDQLAGGNLRTSPESADPDEERRALAEARARRRMIKNLVLSGICLLLLLVALWALLVVGPL
jgi:hypothetical protein